jgi:type II secretory pathway predicted ATPase ExeA
MRSILSRFGLKKEPFTKDLPVDEFYWPAGLEDARQRILAAIKGRASVVMTGDPGTGKTFVLRAVEKALEGQPYRIEYLHNSAVNRWEFYRQICIALGLEPKSSAASLFRLVSQHIEELSCDQKVRPVLYIDEAHMLAGQILSHLPVLLNFRMDSKPFLSLVLVGLSELKETLRRNLQSALNGRLPVRIHLTALDPSEVAAYIEHHMHSAGADKEIFTEEAHLMVAEATGGVMRKINVLALECLGKAASRKSALVDGPCVREAVQSCVEALA